MPAPPVYRPQNVVARKTPAMPAAPPVYRPQSLAMRQAAPPAAYRPQPAAPMAPVGAVQRMKRVRQEGATPAAGNAEKHVKFTPPPLPPPPFGEASAGMDMALTVGVLDNLPTSDIARFSLVHTGGLPASRWLLNRIHGDWSAVGRSGYSEPDPCALRDLLRNAPWAEQGQGAFRRHAPGGAPRTRDDLQLALLARLAHVLFAYAKGGVKTEQEVQCMQLGDKLI